MTKQFLSSPPSSPVIANAVKQSTLRHVDTCMMWIATAIDRLAMTRLRFVGDNGVPLCQKRNSLAMTKQFLSSPSPVIANAVKQSRLRHVDTCMIWIAAAINCLAMTRLRFVGANGVPLCQKRNRLAMTKQFLSSLLLLLSLRTK